MGAREAARRAICTSSATRPSSSASCPPALCSPASSWSEDRPPRPACADAEGGRGGGGAAAAKRPRVSIPPRTASPRTASHRSRCVSTRASAVRATSAGHWLRLGCLETEGISELQDSRGSAGRQAGAGARVTCRQALEGFELGSVNNLLQINAVATLFRAAPALRACTSGGGPSPASRPVAPRHLRVHSCTGRPGHRALACARACLRVNTAASTVAKHGDWGDSCFLFRRRAAGHPRLCWERRSPAAKTRTWPRDGLHDLVQVVEEAAVAVADERPARPVTPAQPLFELARSPVRVVQARRAAPPQPQRRRCTGACIYCARAAAYSTRQPLPAVSACFHARREEQHDRGGVDRAAAAAFHLRVTPVAMRAPWSHSHYKLAIGEVRAN